MKQQLAIVLLQCAVLQTFTGMLMTQSSHANAVLTQNEAEMRAQQIRRVDYKMHFQLPESDPHYSGKVEATVDIAPEASKVSKKILMDFSGEGAVVRSIKLNDQLVEYQFDGTKIAIPTETFRVGNNLLVVEFSHPYSNLGVGFHRTQDKADGKYYMYSNFEPYHANEAFPNFDQPDLKATYTLVVDAPTQWEVIANTLQTQVSQLNPEWKQWTFPTTARFSTYLFALIAGPYKKWESKTESGVPLRLYARESMAEYVVKDVAHWFEVTTEGFKYFEKAFGYPYPFGKYDQILTPDYNHGAMENVGAVTFTERYIFRSEATPLQILRRAETIVHELAHMWFGNLVTMKWWDDLWLNESFATYVSNLAMSKFQDKITTADVWQQFYTGNKEWAYREDDYVTTHPIVGTAADTAEAVANFDGITYGKGASVLKQLVHFIGEEAFLRGLKNYFQEFAFKNATRRDFIVALSKASGKDLIAWENEWLKSSGTNSVQVIFTHKHGHIDKLVLKQFPDEADHQLRSHRTELGFYDLNAQGEIVLRETLSVTYSGAETLVKEALGKAAPRFIFPNVGDHDFVHVILDEKSIAALESSLAQVSDPLLRQMLWSTLWNMVRHAKLPSQHFARIAMANLENEKDLAVISKGLEYLAGIFWYLSSELRPNYYEKVEQFTSSLFRKAPAGSALQISLFNRYVSTARSPDALATLRRWLDQKEVVPGFVMDQERRWSVIHQLSSQGFKEAHELIRKERALDKNDKGVLSAMVAEAAFPDETNKKTWWNRILARDASFEKMSIEKSRAIMSVFHHLDYPELTRFTAETFFEALPQLGEIFPDAFNTSFASSMYPGECSEVLDRRVGEFLDRNPTLHVAPKRELLKNRQLHQRTLQARSLSQSAH